MTCFCYVCVCHCVLLFFDVFVDCVFALCFCTHRNPCSKQTQHIAVDNGGYVLELMFMFMFV